ncbi:hypothetical protein THASP1DRAFT_33118 [Thamnocephalis sphaerospora]|uniref:Wax synthase domain-containing protein n=1 Tax=Thamnocephalis sphaerospora TaxID=78915 RepID=A0A4P9XHB3_9FUNG|nr:hypothetical protein THASP1DRAFT_33118 [Thamnocephalis sphaerospora]|eukprot:RKP05054.1 hypothetical protein THASP1DRAFT_33118 [Thamnocephalis sphaerospora]
MATVTTTAYAPYTPHFSSRSSTCLALVSYLGLIVLHVVLHYRLASNAKCPPKRVYTRSAVISTSLFLLPYWHNLDPELYLVNATLVFWCMYGGLRMAILSAAVAALANGRQADDEAKAPVCIHSFANYLRHLCFLEPPRRTGHLAAIVAERVQPCDPVQSALASLVHRYNSWLEWTGWNALSGWTRYPIRILIYEIMAQVPIAYLSRHRAQISALDLDLDAAASSLGISRWEVVVRRFPVAMALYLTLYFCLLAFLAIFFDLILLMTGKARRGDFLVRPWMAASPRELWSARWNLQMQATFASAVYFPVCRLLDAIAARFIASKPAAKALEATPDDVTATMHNENAAVPAGMQRINRLIAAQMVFVASALFHEILVASLTNKGDWDNTRFFCFQGAVVLACSIAETCLAPILPAVLMPRGRLPFIVGWPIVAVSLVATGHWFFRPFIRAGIVDHLLDHYALL